MPQGSFSSKWPYSTPSRRSPRNMSVSGSPVIGILDERSNIMGFLAWKLQVVTPYVAVQPNAAPQTRSETSPIAKPRRQGMERVERPVGHFLSGAATRSETDHGRPL